MANKAEFEFEGLDELNDVLADLPDDVLSQMGPGVFAAADLIKTEAALSIVRGSTQGAGHVPSPPGEPPHRDTAQLDTSGVTRITGEAEAEISFNTPYAAAQEFGSPKIDLPERPYLRPAIKKKTPDAVDLLAQAAASVIRKMGKNE